MAKKRKRNASPSASTSRTDSSGRNDTKMIRVEGMDDACGVQGDSNMLIVLPKKKEKEKKKQNEPKVKKLSKKERKRLTNILQRRENKDKRAELLSSLSQHQATEEEMKLFTSITEVYSQNFKSSFSADNTFQMKANAIKGSRKKKKLLTPKPEVEEQPESTDTDDMSTDEEVERIMEEAEMEEEDGQKNETPEKAKELASKPGEIQVADKKVEEHAVEKPSGPPKQAITAQPVTFIPVDRPADIQEARLKLPILAEEQVVMETIKENPVVIICGETGSGKTTQVPQFLYESGYAHGSGKICVTEPRRVAAISMSQRVAKEMALTSAVVSYQIRFEGNVTPQTRIKFVTDGVLLKEAQQDPLLSQYSAVIIDEAHERSVYTDILVGLLSIIVRQRAKRNRPLKLIIMSATLRVEDFTAHRMFKEPPPLVKVEARQFPVTIHFNKKTSEDYLTDAYRKVCKIHRSLPEGAILVFVTGQLEVHRLVKKLRTMFPYTRGQDVPEKGEKQSRRQRKRKVEEEATKTSEVPEINLDNYSVLPQDDEEAEKLEEMTGGDGTNDEDLSLEDLEDEEEEDAMRVKMGEDKPDNSIPMYVLPLYSLLPSDKQAKVFEPPPIGCRLCVVATNVAETSLTIPNVRYVVDTGKTKTKLYDPVTGVSTFAVTSVSQASADQRAGRAGRTGPGHCYRLYSSAVFSDLAKFSPPEISRRPVDDLVLQMKSMRIDKVANFPFPTAPETDQIKAAETLLQALDALRRLTRSNRMKDLKAQSPVITELGQQMACFPVAPRYAKMLVLAKLNKVLPYVIALVAALSVGEIWETSPHDPGEDEAERHRAFRGKMNIFKSKLVDGSLLLGDMMLLLTAVGACEAEGCSTTFCQQLGVRVKAMREIRKLRMHLTNAANLVFPEESSVVDPNLAPPNEAQVLTLRKVVLGGMADHVARRNPPPPPGAERSEVKRLRGSYQSLQLEEPVYIHPESVLYGHQSQAEYLAYQAIEEINGKLLMRGVCCVESHWFPALAPAYCVLSKPLEEPPPRWEPSSGRVMCHRTASFGRCNWEVPATEMEYPDTVDKYRLFAQYLLDGSVFPPLAQHSLVLSPATMVKSWAKLQPKTERLLKALLDKGICSKGALEAIWKKQPKYLQREYLEWVKDTEQGQVMLHWPPVHS